MAISTLFVDGFDHYATADIAKKWTSHSNGVIGSTTKRTGTQALTFVSNSGGNNVSKTLPVQVRTVVVGLAYQPPSAPGGTPALIVLGAGSTGSGGGQFVLALNGALTVSVYRGYHTSSIITGTLLGTSTATLTTGAWNYLELRAYIDDTAGEYEVRLNGVSILSGTAVDTKQQTANYVDVVQLLCGAVVSFIDDLYIRGDTVLTAGGFLGDCKVLTRYPDAPGTYTQLTPSAGANWQCVDEALFNGDTDFNSGSTVGNRDTYAMQALGDSGTIKAVQAVFAVKKTDAGSRTVKPYIKSGATEVAGTAQGLSTDYQFVREVYSVDPNTGAEWSTPAYDAVEVGVEVGA